VSLARGTTIDAYLSTEANNALYKLWNEQKSWPAPLEFPGGIKAITCEMIQDVINDKLGRSQEAFTQVFQGKFGKEQGEKLALEILDAVVRNIGR